MKASAVGKARVRLIAARKAVSELDYSLPPEEFHAAWYTFLTATKNIFTQLDKGAEGNARSMQWFGSKNTERRKDPLLQYLFQARDDDEHSNGLVLEEVEQAYSFGPNDAGSTWEVIYDPVTLKRTVRLNIKSRDGKPVKVMGRIPHLRLRTVTGRGPRTYDPPTHHLGRLLSSNWPIHVAEVALDYLEDLVSEAETLPR